VLLASSFLNAAYFLPIVHKAFFEGAEEKAPDRPRVFHPAPQSVGAAAAGNHDGRAHEAPHELKEPSYFLVVPLFVCAVISVLMGIYPELLLELVKQVIR
jgi:formate hydrogenlyase subunit 3/multisubunit Na+/H+ antiporter MnhD subunit